MTSVNGVSRCAARANYTPPIWENTVSEGRHNLTYMINIVLTAESAFSMGDAMSVRPVNQRQSFRIRMTSTWS